MHNFKKCSAGLVLRHPKKQLGKAGVYAIDLVDHALRARTCEGTSPTSGIP